MASNFLMIKFSFKTYVRVFFFFQLFIVNCLASINPPSSELLDLRLPTVSLQLVGVEPATAILIRFSTNKGSFTRGEEHSLITDYDGNFSYSLVLPAGSNYLDLILVFDHNNSGVADEADQSYAIYDTPLNEINDDEQTLYYSNNFNVKTIRVGPQQLSSVSGISLAKIDLQPNKKYWCILSPNVQEKFIRTSLLNRFNNEIIAAREWVFFHEYQTDDNLDFMDDGMNYLPSDPVDTEYSGVCVIEPTSNKGNVSPHESLDNLESFTYDAGSFNFD